MEILNGSQHRKGEKQMEQRFQTLRLKDTRLIFRNFAGRADANGYNNEGDRNVCIVLDDISLVQDLIKEGWNIKQTKPREGFEDEFQPSYYVKANVKYRDKTGALKAYPPMIYVVTNKQKVLLNEDTVAQLDHAEIQDVRVELSPYRWTKGSKSGISVYVTKMYVHVIEDEFDNVDDWDDFPDADEE